MQQLLKPLALCVAGVLFAAAPAAAQFGGVAAPFGGGGSTGGAGGKVQTAAARKAEAQILEAMAKPCTIEFKEVPLTDVVTFFKKTCNVNVVLDTIALDEIGIGSDTPVTLSVDKITVRSALALLLKPLDLTWMIRNEVLMITTYEEAEGNLSTRMYPVGDLTKETAEDGGLVHRGAGPGADYDSMIDAITRTIEPESWDEVGGPGSITGLTVAGKNLLVVSQTDGVHEQLVNFFAALRDVPAMPGKKPAKANGEAGGGYEGAGSEGMGAGKPAADKSGAVLKIYPLDPNQIDRDADLAKLIEKSVEPRSWKAEDYSVTGVAGAVVVRNTKDVHKQVVSLLNGMQVLRDEANSYYSGGSSFGVGSGGFGGGGGLGGGGGGGFGGGGNAGGFFGAAGK